MKKSDILQEIKMTIGEKRVDAWLHTPIRSLDNRRPVDVLSEPGGEDEIRKILNAINHGIPY